MWLKNEALAREASKKRKSPVCILNLELHILREFFIQSSNLGQKSLFLVNKYKIHFPVKLLIILLSSAWDVNCTVGSNRTHPKSLKELLLISQITLLCRGVEMWGSVRGVALSHLPLFLSEAFPSYLCSGQRHLEANVVGSSQGLCLYCCYWGAHVLQLYLPGHLR